MCGILFSIKRENKVDFESRLNLISHRGIETKVLSHVYDSFLGHVRLPLQTEINDEYEQPVEIGKNSYLLYNGEIFNYHTFGDFENDVDYLKNLFSDLDGLNTNLLSEKIVDLVERESPKWDGFWAICLVFENRVFCFTDPLGKKQLYYNREIGISSEIKPILDPQKYLVNVPYCKESYLDSNSNDRSYRMGKIWNRAGIILDSVSNEDYTPYLTPFLSVKRLVPGDIYGFTFFEEDKEKLIYNSKSYGNRSLHPVLLHQCLYSRHFEKKTSNDLRSIIRESISNRLINKLDNNSFLLSGGLDSTIILHESVSLENIGSSNFVFIENDEDSKYIDLLEREYGINVNRVSLEEDLDYLFWYESPIDMGSVKKQFQLFKSIPSNSSVVITGDGSDELFGGYRRSKNNDTQIEDVYGELSYYHLPRIDRASMRYTKECRNPFLSKGVINFAMSLPWESRIDKIYLKSLYKGHIPDEILTRKKTPLRDESLNIDKPEFRKKSISSFIKYFSKENGKARNRIFLGG